MFFLWFRPVYGGSFNCELNGMVVQSGFSIQSFQQGEQQAFNFIFARYYRALCFFANSFIPAWSAAEDITQDSFVRLWEKHDEFSCQQAIKAFLYIITRNACLNFLKQCNRERKHGETWGSTHDHIEDSLLPNLLHAEVMNGIVAAINELPPECRKVIELCFMEGLKNHEIAEELRLSVHTIKNQKARGLYLLKKRLRPT